MPSSRQSGNVLFLILIAVALFAALSYAITKSSRSGSGNVSNEKATLSASRLINFASDFQTAVLRLTTSNTVQLWDLKYNNDVYKKADGTLIFSAMGTPADPSLYLFHPKGGGLAPQVFEDIGVACPACATNITAIGHMSISWVNPPYMGTSASDGAIVIVGLSEAVCQAINTKNSISIIPILNVFLSAISGSTGPTSVTAIGGATAADSLAIRGKLYFCYKEVSANARYNFLSIFKIN